VYLVFDVPPAGYDASDLLEIYDGFRDQLAAGSDALITKLLGGES
jgi:hypothetical protein